MQLFYAPEILNLPFLPPDESLHAVKVLRLAAGSEIGILDGIGGFFRARIVLANQKKCAVEIMERLPESGSRNYYMHIAVSPVKNIDRFEWFVEKAVEFGVDEITPVFCRFSERKNINIERLQKITVAACKQSQKAKFPTINFPADFYEFINRNIDFKRFIAHCQLAEKYYLGDILRAGEKSTVLIGPEGDFSEKEIEAAVKSGFMPVSLGNSRLRTETAGVFAAAIAAHINNTGR
jgi:16S rRNA (uracil1498-N3)-methyltransferase